MMIPLRHLPNFRSCARLLAAASLTELRGGDAVAAHAHQLGICALVNALEKECLMISQLVRIAIAHFGLNVCWEFLQSDGLTEGQLDRLQTLISDWEFIGATERTLNMERAICDTTLIQCRNRSGSVRDMQVIIEGMGDDGVKRPVSFWRGLRAKFREDAWRHWWSYSDQLNALRAAQINIEAARQVQVDGYFGKALARQKDRLAELGTSPKSDEDSSIETMEVRRLFTGTMVVNGKLLERVMTVEALRQMTIAATALKRYELKHGTVPASLEKLVSDYLPAVPRDPVDGNPLRYRPTERGAFLLYSIGEDAVDDGCDPRPTDEGSKTFLIHRGRDWVWPQPATPDEVAAYEAARLSEN